MANLFIVCGHGGSDPGSVGGGQTEAERVRALAARVKALGGSSVTVGDTSFDWYTKGSFNTYAFPKDAQVLELHMDAFNGSARGGHVIINAQYNADKYDNALASFISVYFPGRSTTISKRSDLANCNICAKRGVSYRLLECCFIDNTNDRNKFNANLDTIATGILAAFDIKASASTPAPIPSPGTLYRVQVGAYASKSNANAMADKLKAAGFDAYITTK